MNYDEITKQIFYEFKELFKDGVIGILNKSLNDAYIRYNCQFDFDKTVQSFKKMGYIFLNLKDAPIPLCFHANDIGYQNAFALLGPLASKADPLNVLFI